MSQKIRLLELLRVRGETGVTPLDALHIVGSFRLAARVYDLRAEGYAIEAHRINTPNGAEIACYTLHEEPVQLEAFG